MTPSCADEIKAFFEVGREFSRSFSGWILAARGTRVRPFDRMVMICSRRWRGVSSRRVREFGEQLLLV
jgi:hypothetical protein